MSGSRMSVNPRSLLSLRAKMETTKEKEEKMERSFLLEPLETPLVCSLQ